MIGPVRCELHGRKPITLFGKENFVHTNEELVGLGIFDRTSKIERYECVHLGQREEDEAGTILVSVELEKGVWEEFVVEKRTDGLIQFRDPGFLHVGKLNGKWTIYIQLIAFRYPTLSEVPR
ncbi:hypothetical protein HN858_01590 [Candidatus Falkowbacteria bacterium]|jgi:hypothetical protein|nr:hypothetical protein [Candidatus Falkowbacteria bacterium]MBT5503776.1 hypothetical protein [Candidatus Falkowbacteria bacterium]MBT6573935.1 hypothetical protein [Candidatus Falkowbacteria bacterium]MBT7348346.1 hypothetical protein [Candidatus Falkowbacteria bacterium]MBT7500270.1 hypothetical protein [Candidatus Falkowbacteria bacterium]